MDWPTNHHKNIPPTLKLRRTSKKQTQKGNSSSLWDGVIAKSW